MLVFDLLLSAMALVMVELCFPCAWFVCSIMLVVGGGLVLLSTAGHNGWRKLFLLYLIA